MANEGDIVDCTLCLKWSLSLSKPMLVFIQCVILDITHTLPYNLENPSVHTGCKSMIDIGEGKILKEKTGFNITPARGLGVGGAACASCL